MTVSNRQVERHLDRIVLVHASLPTGPDLDPRRKAAFLAVGSGRVALAISLPRSGPTSIVTAEDDQLAAPGVVAQAVEAEAGGADAVVINCTADTGFEAARDAVGIPVVGVARAAFHLAAQMARRCSIVTFSDRVVPRLRDQASAEGLGDRLASVRVVDLGLEDLPDTERLAADLAEAILRCHREDDAGAVILGCTDFEVAARALRERLAGMGVSIPVVAPLETAVWMAEGLVTMGLGRRRP